MNQICNKSKLDKEKEAETNHATKQQIYDNSKEEIAARQAREAMIENHLQLQQKAKQVEAAKLEKKRIDLQEKINTRVTVLSQTFQQILPTMERQQLDLVLKQHR